MNMKALAFNEGTSPFLGKSSIDFCARDSTFFCGTRVPWTQRQHYSSITLSGARGSFIQLMASCPSSIYVNMRLVCLALQSNSFSRHLEIQKQRKRKHIMSSALK